VRAYDEYGSTIYADPICIYPENVEDSSETLVPEDSIDEDGLLKLPTVVKCIVLGR
jgi:hypothetical protein